MKKALAILTLSALAGLVSCSNEREPPRDLTPQERNLVVSSNQFGFSLFKEVVSQSDGGNVFVSPLSVSMALGMVYNGARGDTEAGMRVALAYRDLTQEEINQSYLSLIEFLTRLDPKVTMEIANSIWMAQGLAVLEAFLELSRKFFLAEVTTLDFADPGAADIINAWVNEKTHGKIEEIVEKPLDPILVMFLINAVYFKGDWTLQFDKAETVDASFHAPAGDLPAKLMTLHDDKFSYLETEALQAIDLPYGEGYFSMTVILPREGKTVDELVSGLDSAGWAAWMADLQEMEGTLWLPRFELEYKQSLPKVLSALGMEIAFSMGGADFTGIRTEPGLFISDVKHKTYLKVDEVGTEAAAVTDVEVGDTSAPITFAMKVDRPFLIVIHDRLSQTLLFMGKIVAPDSK